MGLKRIYVEKKPEFAIKAKALKEELVHYLKLNQITQVRILIRYDMEDISEATYKKSLGTIFSEPPLDFLYEEQFPYQEQEQFFSVEYLPGQFDQRADSAVQCIKLLSEEDPLIRSGITYVITGLDTVESLDRVKAFCINPVDSREAERQKPTTLQTKFMEPADIEILKGFCELDENGIKLLYDSLQLAMTDKDFIQIREYFSSIEKRDPSMTEIRVLDTYWSDHCRHTTFQTEIKELVIAEGFYKKAIENTYHQYLTDRVSVLAGKQKDICFMDLALLAMKKLKKEGKLTDLEESEEINACSIVVPVTIAGVEQEWLVNFKNETHNHPTEIEPYGGAATCLGGAIRDPLSGRTYVYQAMRITGAADPTKSLTDTIKGKLPQRKIVRQAAEGYSSYGNQIGLATGYVKELYHPGYAAKRMEIGAVLGAAPRDHIIRETVQPGDQIILLGGRTGRDGIGGATGSSKIHTENSIEVCGAEVQKGNPPTERKIQRLFRHPEVSRMIKKCNDFGAGGVAVAIGELADGLLIELDQVPKKYAGLDGTELAISESQERMAIVVDTLNVEQMLSYAEAENLEAVVVAEVTKAPRLIMTWRGKTIVNISREFLNTNGAHQECKAYIEMPEDSQNPFLDNPLFAREKYWLTMLEDLNVCSQKGLVEMFDSSIGAGSVLMPYGGKYQLSEGQTMVAKLPVWKGETDTVTIMSYGYDPYLSDWSPYHGAIYGILSSVAKVVAVGGDYKKIHFTFQEYFKRMTADPKRWGQPLAALLGAYQTQIELGLAAIGGKDSMSGTFYDEKNGELHVPPTLVSFAVGVGTVQNIISQELKKAGTKLVCCRVKKDQYHLPDFQSLMKNYESIFADIQAGKVLSAYAIERHGVAEAVTKMAFGNKLGVTIADTVTAMQLFAPGWGDILCEISADQWDSLSFQYELIGEVNDSAVFIYQSEQFTMAQAICKWCKPLEKVFPTKSSIISEDFKTECYQEKNIYIGQNRVAKPKVFIPVFPGTNCEYDSIKAFERAGASVTTQVFKNLTAAQIKESVEVYRNEIKSSQIVMLPGGFSAGDEPDGSAKFFATVFRNEVVKEELENLLANRDGLILGICNGFQALIKLGLVPEGRITTQDETSPTLAVNTIGRHTSKMIYTKVVSKLSPWLQQAELGKVYCNPISHGEGRFVANQEWLKKLLQQGQVATQYVNEYGNPTMDEEWNPNGSYQAIEGITSRDGRILGKMAHSERIGRFVAINICGEQDIRMFESGVNYFK